MADDDYERQCRERMQAALEEMNVRLDSRLTAQDAQIAAIRSVQGEHARRLEEGTQIILGMDQKINTLTHSTTSLAASTQPIIDAMELMQTGILMLATFGRGCQRVGRWLAIAAATCGEWGLKFAKFAIVVGSVGLFVRALWLGQSFASAWSDLVRLIK